MSIAPYRDNPVWGKHEDRLYRRIKDILEEKEIVYHS
jgi:hypothetical protein